MKKEGKKEEERYDTRKKDEDGKKKNNFILYFSINFINFQYCFDFFNFCVRTFPFYDI